MQWAGEIPQPGTPEAQNSPAARHARGLPAPRTLVRSRLGRRLRPASAPSKSLRRQSWHRTLYTARGPKMLLRTATTPPAQLAQQLNAPLRAGLARATRLGGEVSEGVIEA